MIDLMIRAETRARFRALAISRGLLTEITNPAGAIVYADGVDIDELGQVVVTPAVMNGTTVVTPAVLDTWFTFYVRLSRDRSTSDEDTLYTGETEATAGVWRFARSKFARFVREQATQVTTPWGGRAYQFGTSPNRIQLLDPRDATHAAKHEWAGGMNL
jgi:hypothetical protein